MFAQVFAAVTMVLLTTNHAEARAQRKRSDWVDFKQ